MPNPEKIEIVESTKKAAQNAKSIVLADYKGLTVEQDTKLRQDLREKSIDYRVIKNRLAKISFSELGIDEIKNYLSGPTAIAFGFDDPIEPIRLLMASNKKIEKPSIKAVWLEGKLLSNDETKTIVNLPPKEQLIAMFVGGLNAPLVNFIGGLRGMLQKLAATLKAVQDTKQE